MMVLGRTEHNLKLIKKLVFVLILFALFFGFSKTAYALTEATFLPSSYNLGSGQSFNYKLRELDPVSFRKATTAEYNSALPNLTSDNIVSTADSDYPIYLWLDANDTALYYSEADKIYANADSERMFYEVKHLVNADVSGFDTSRVTNMEQMFFNSGALITLDLSSWDTSNVTNMGAMFEQCIGLVSIDFTGWDVRNVNIFSRMFCDCSVTSLDLSSFVTSSATLMEQMFASDYNLTSLNISNFDTSNVTNMWAMFEGIQVEELDVTSFDVSKVTDMSRMFNSCSKLRTLDLSSFEPKSVVYMSQMFNWCLKLTTIYVDPVKWGSPRPRFSNQMFGADYRIMGQNGTTYVGSDDGTFNLSRARVDDPENDKPGYLTDVALKGQLYHSITYPDGRVFIVEHNAGLDLEPNETTNGTYQSGEITFIYHNGVTEPTTTSQTVTMVGDGYTADGIHYYDNGISWNNSFWVRATKDITLEYAYKPEVLPGQDFPIATKEGKIFTGWYTEEDGGTKVTSYSETEPLTLHAHYDNRTSFLEEGYSISSKIGNITNYSDSLNTFRKATESEYNNIKDSLTEDNIVSTEDSHFPTYMWYDGENVLYYSEADYIYINDYAGDMFSSTSFISIDLSGLYTNNVNYMANMFAYNERLQEVYFGDNFDTSNVTDMSYMFYNCSSLTYIDFYNIDMSSVTTTSEMFYNCSSLTYIDFKRKPLRSLEYAYDMFYGCSSLTYLDLTMFDNSNLYDYGYMFNNMPNLETIYVSDLWNEDNYYYEQYNVFTYSTKLVGGAGTIYDENHDTSEYARVDDPNNDKPGYFTYREFRPMIYHPYNNWDVDYGSSYTFEDNYQGDNTHVATVTLNKNYDGSEDDYAYVDIQFTLTKWQVEKNEYDFGDTIIVDQDIYLDPIGVETIIGADLSPAYRENYKFTGWYTEPEGGELVERYDTEEDITLYAHWTEATTVPVTTPDGIVYVPYGEEYNLGVNDLYQFYAEAEYVYLDYNLGDDSDPPMTIMTEFLKGNGWLVDGVHYDDNSVITVTEPITIERDNIIDKPPYVLPKPTNGNKYFAGWYAWGNFNSEPYEIYYGGGDITLVARWIDDPVSLTIDGETTMVERGYIYTVPNATPDPYAPVNNKIHLHLYYMDEEDTQKDVVIYEGYSIGYQIINGDTYYPGDTYVVNDETEVVSIYDWNGQYAMDPYIKEPTRDGYIFMGWQLYNWEYYDVSDINVDIYTIEPYYTWFDGASFYAEWQEEPDPDEYVVVRYKDYIKKKDYKKIYPKGYVYTFGDLAEVNSFDVEIRNNVNDDTATVTYTTHITSNSYTVKIVGSDDESWRNSNNWYHPGDTYEINEDIEINVLTAAYTDNSHYNGGCSGNAYLCELALATAENSRYNNYIFRGVYTGENGQGIKLNPHAIMINNTYYESHNGFNTLWVYLEEVDENSVIVTVDGEVFIMPKGEGTIPSPSITSEVTNYTITYKFNNGDPDVLGIDTVRYYIGSLDYNGDEYQLGDTFDFEEDTTFWSNWELEPIGDGLLEVNDEHFLGWFDENDNQVTSLDDIDDNITLYAQWTTEPTVEICHGKGDCEEIVKGTTVTLERPEPTVITAHFTLDYNTEEPGYDPKNVTTTRTETVEYYMINNERYDFGETYTFNENVDMYGVTTYTYTSDFVGYYNDNWDHGLNINGYELRGWCATRDGRYCRYYDEDEDIVQPDGLTLYATYYSSEGDTVRVTVDWDTQYDWPKGESILIPDDIVENIAFAEPQSYSREIDFDLNDGSGETLSGSIAVNEVFSHFRVGNDDVKKYQQHDLYTFYRDIHIQSQFVDEYGEIDFPEMNEPTFKGWYTKPEGGRRIKNTEDFVKYMDLYNSFTLYAHYGEISEELESVLYVVANKTNEDQSVTRFIVGADAGTLISEFKENMDNPNEYIKIYDLDNNEVSDDDIIKTGLTIKLVIDGNIYDEATMVVRGDMDGDGIVNITDLLQVKNHIQELTLIEDPIRFIAANVVTDDILNVSDQLKLSNYLNENIDTLNE